MARRYPFAHQPGSAPGLPGKGKIMRVWFITGASRGFGALIAEAALKAGDAVVATARDPATVTARLGQHERLLATRLDVTSEAEAHAAAGEAVKKFGRIDILINNAGYGLLGAIEEASAAETQRLFGTNVFGLLGVSRAVLPHMRRQRSGHVINISSVGGYTGYPGWGVYGATKFAVEGISEALAAEVAPLGIKVTVVEPGFFRTDFLDESSLSRTAQQIEDYHASVGKTRAVAADFNHGQRGDPRKLAGAILKLVNAETPPLRLPLGSDTVERIETKNAFVARELAEWRTVATSTDFTEEV
ncbi:NAD(P)-dependent dehydrogenase (short-subunit alcohol dehydrogenase family) [Bradyrhizobium sp. USDA 3315]